MARSLEFSAKGQVLGKVDGRPVENGTVAFENVFGEFPQVVGGELHEASAGS